MGYGVPGAPDAELRRSPAADVVGRLAAASGLRLAHFEHRLYLPLPEEWVPANRPDLAGGPVWQRGRLVEHKYAHFRHDEVHGSFHPGHRAKWTAHELCHGLVGCAWRPDATPLFHTLAARLAELVPVALWYFFDEAWLRRCPDHEGQGPLFDLFCPACERAAEQGPLEHDPRAERRLADGRAFVEAELAAIARSRREGRPIAHRYATLDLQSDGLAYCAQHARRLASPVFRRWFEQLHGPALGGHAHLDDLEARVVEVVEALAGGAPARPLAGGAERVVAADLGWRLLQVTLECEGPVVREIESLVDRLAAAPAAVAEVLQGYEALCGGWFLPPAADVFAVGYDLPHGYGRSAAQVAAGLAEVCPHVEALLADDFEEAVAAFVAADVPVRQPVARRFATWLAAERPGPVADVAAYEAAIAHPGPADGPLDALGQDAAADDRVRRAAGVEVLRLGLDPAEVVAALADESAPDPEERPTALVVRRTSGGDVVVAEVGPAAADALARLEAGPLPADALGLPPDEVASLRTLGLLAPAAWRLTSEA